VNIKKLLFNKELEIESGSIQPQYQSDSMIKPYPRNRLSKVGKYPHQLIHKAAGTHLCKNVKISNGSVSYRERAAKSAYDWKRIFYRAERPQYLILRTSLKG
jgi:hypothetical protein